MKTQRCNQVLLTRHVKNPQAAQASTFAERVTYMLFTIEGNCPKLNHFLSGNRHVIFAYFAEADSLNSLKVWGF